MAPRALYPPKPSQYGGTHLKFDKKGKLFAAVQRSEKDPPHAKFCEVFVVESATHFRSVLVVKEIYAIPQIELHPDGSAYVYGEGLELENGTKPVWIDDIPEWAKEA